MDSNAKAALLGALIGGFFAIGGAFFAQWLSEIRQRENLRKTFGAELRAMLTVVNEMGLISQLAETVLEIRERMTSRFYSVRIGSWHSAIFFANAEKLGLLPSLLSERLVFAHHEIGGIALDLNQLADMGSGGGGVYGERARADWQICERYHEAALNRCLNIRSVVADLINELDPPPE